MRNYLIIITLTAMMGTGCSAQKNSLAENINFSAKKEIVEDSVLKKLQVENDLLIAYTVENFAWVKSVDYRILVQNGNEWRGYSYHKNLMHGGAGSPTTISPTTVDKASCNALLDYIIENKAWTIPGDSENGFCADANKNCNINDAAGNSLWLITKEAAVKPSYYAAEFYEKCCPEKQRGIFVSIGKKIIAIIGETGAEQ